MTIRNMRGGIWWRLRCNKCQKVKLECNAEHYRTLKDVTNQARLYGWFVGIKAVDIQVLCPKCKTKPRFDLAAQVKKLGADSLLPPRRHK
jgi:phage FluMu protein Com